MRNHNGKELPCWLVIFPYGHKQQNNKRSKSDPKKKGVFSLIIVHVCEHTAFCKDNSRNMFLQGKFNVRQLMGLLG